VGVAAAGRALTSLEPSTLIPSVRTWRADCQLASGAFGARVCIWAQAWQSAEPSGMHPWRRSIDSCKGLEPADWLPHEHCDASPEPCGTAKRPDVPQPSRFASSGKCSSCSDYNALGSEQSCGTCNTHCCCMSTGQSTRVAVPGVQGACRGLFCLPARMRRAHLALNGGSNWTAPRSHALTEKIGGRMV
jgi:hypothetical protein